MGIGDESMINVENLAFSYKQQESFITDLSFRVSGGEIFGFLGPSGAGKSTLQKILCGILKDYHGSVKVFDGEVKNRNKDFYQEIGVDFEFPNLYGKFSGLDNLKYFASLYEKKTLDPEPLLERVGLKEHQDKKVSEYSKGMKMRLAFVRAILHEPKLLFLDEPTSGLDPSYARILKEMILEQKQMGKTVILTTHNMHDAEELCDRVAFIVDGEIKAVGTPMELKASNAAVEVRYAYLDGKEIKEQQSSLKGLYQDEAFIKYLREGRITSIHSKEPTLEDVFMEVTGRRLV